MALTFISGLISSTLAPFLSPFLAPLGSSLPFFASFLAPAAPPALAFGCSLSAFFKISSSISEGNCNSVQMKTPSSKAFLFAFYSLES